MPGTNYDYEGLMWAESADLAALIDELDDVEFDHASLCDGWRVRDVVSHMLLGHTTPMLSMMGLIARQGFNVPKASRNGSAQYGSAHSPAEIRAGWRGVVDGRVRKGIAKVISTKEGFVDHLIHQQDIRRPLGRSRSIAADRLVAALDAMPTIGGFVKAKQRMRGLGWKATDVDWSFGDGPQVIGPAEALILLSSGRPAPIDEVSGDGVTKLKERLAA
ncbi:MAG TPA: maleylpyruvate isomerase family mycothiol-dependent enzyme [Ilumatobacteraceae bacterium]|nr:maleylpyruvate isomerase family mycothiol-dependent enzyme [Ilumatobacteraceae bacterium]